MRLQQIVKNCYSLSYVVIGLVLCIFFYPMLFEGQFPYYRDGVNYYYPFTQFLNQAVSQGEYPLWNPHVDSGIAQWQLPDPNLIYPFSLLFLILPFNWAINWVIVIHHLIAALGMFYWLRHHRFAQPIAVVIGLVFSLSGYMLSLHNNHGFMLACAWMPWIMVALDCSLRTPSLKSWLYLTVFGGIHLLCGRPDITYYFAFYTVIYIGLRLLTRKQWVPIAVEHTQTEPSEGGDAIPLKLPIKLGWAIGLGLPGALLFALLLSGVLMAALWELKGFSTNMLSGHSYDAVVDWSLVPIQLLTLFVPKLFGDAFFSNELLKFIGLEPLGFSLFIISIYFGIGTLSFLSIACLYWRKHIGIGMHLILVVLIMGFVLGDYNGFFPWMYEYVPGLKSIRYPVKAFGIVMLSICFMAAWGMHQVMEKQLSRRYWFVNGILLLGMVGFGIYLSNEGSIIRVLQILSPGVHLKLSSNQFLRIETRLGSAYWLAVSIYSLFILLYYARFRQWLPQTAAYGLIGALALCDIAYHNSDLLWVTTPERLFFQSPVEQHIQAKIAPHRYQYRLYYDAGMTTPKDFMPDYADVAVWRVMKYSIGAVLANHSMFMDFLSTDGYLAPSSQLRHYLDILNASKLYSINNPQRLRLNALLASKYAYLQHDSEKVSFDSKYYGPARYFKEYDIHVVEIKKTLARAYTRSRYILSASPSHIFELVATGMSPSLHLAFDPFREVIIGVNSQNQAYLEQFHQHQYLPGYFKAIEPILIDPMRNSVSIFTANRKKAFLILTDVYYPGWKVYVDGQARPLLLANFFQRAVALEPGMHHVYFSYEPANFHLARLFSLITLGIIACLFLLTLRRKQSNYASR